MDIEIIIAQDQIQSEQEQYENWCIEQAYYEQCCKDGTYNNHIDEQEYYEKTFQKEIETVAQYYNTVVNSAACA